MSVPTRNADPARIQAAHRTFFVTTSTYMSQHLLQSERNATLLIDVLLSCVRARRFQLHDFVIMPNHVHLLLTLPDTITIEKAVQFIKGGFSFRLRRETGYAGEVWHRGFSDHRVDDPESFRAHRRYIALNPVKAGIVSAPQEFPCGLTSLAKQKAG